MSSLFTYNHLLRFSIAWFLISQIWFPAERNSITFLLNNIGKIPSELITPSLFGSDYFAYQQLQQTPPDTSIAFLIPDSYYLPKSVLFLYPRPIKVFSHPKQLTSEALKEANYALIYVSSPEYRGLIPNLDYYQRTSWDPQSLENLDKTLSNQSIDKDKQTQIPLMDKLKKNGGVLLYHLK